MPLTRRALSTRLAAPLAALAGCALTGPAPAQPTNPLVVLPNPYPSGLIYVLQHDNSTIQQLIQSSAGWKILEPSTNGLPSGDLTRLQVASMQAPSNGPCLSIALAYLSIGEAEDYRSYWNPAWVDANGDPIPGVAPAWLGPENPEWEGNYKVRYWHRAWKQNLFGTATGPNRTPLDRIIDQGFDGVYLDVVDAFDYWSDENPELSRRLARERMVALLEQISAYAVQTRGQHNFRVVIQNGADIVWDDNNQPDDLRDRVATVVRGIGHEDLFYDATKPQPAAHTQRALDATRDMFANVVFPTFGPFPFSYFAIDYVIAGRNTNSAANRTRAADFYQKAMNQGLLPYAARSDRELDEVLSLNGPKWTITQPNGQCTVCDVCLLDLTGAASGASLHAPDGRVDAADYAFFLRAYTANETAADLTTTSTRTLPGYARPDGRVTFEDMAFFLSLYAQANPSR